METLVIGSFAAMGFGSLFLAFVAYMLPWIIALLRGTRSAGIFFFNLLLGWTAIGWVVALIWAFVAARKSNQQVIIIKEVKEAK